MKHTKLSKNINSNGQIPEKLLNQIISAAYGDAGLFTKIKINILAKKDKNISDTFLQFKKTADSVKEIEKEKCPEELITKAFNNVKTKRTENKSFLFDFYSIFFTKPLASTLVAASLVIVVVLASLFNSPAVQQASITQAELDSAQKQTKEAISIVARVFAKTKKTLETDVLAQKVSEPISKGINTINELFIEGGKNEKVN